MIERKTLVVDGNKRTALAATGIFLELNGHTLTADNEAVLEFTRHVVVGGMEIVEMAAWWPFFPSHSHYGLQFLSPTRRQ
jgi:prophage maintenance system killer protein